MKQKTLPNFQKMSHSINLWAWLLIGRLYTFRPKGRRFESRSNRHIVTLGKSFTRSWLWRFGVKLRHSIHAVS